MNDVLGPLNEDARLRRIAPAISAIIPVEDRGRHELLRIAASLAQGLPDGYAQEIQQAAAALAVHPVPLDKRLSYSANFGTLARIGGRVYVLGRIARTCARCMWDHIKQSAMRFTGLSARATQCMQLPSDPMGTALALLPSISPPTSVQSPVRSHVRPPVFPDDHWLLVARLVGR